MTTPTRWYAAHVRSGSESLVVQGLLQKDFVAFCPSEQRRSPRSVVTSRSLFPGYVFVEFDITENRWPMIGRLHGVIKLLPAEHETPLPMPAGFIDEIRDREASGEFGVKPLADALLHCLPGDRIQLLPGAVSQYSPADVGAFVEKRSNRIIVLMSFFGRPQRVSVPMTKVDARAISS